MKYADSENMKADRVNTVVFKLNQIKRRVFLFVFFFLGGGGGIYLVYHSKAYDLMTNNL